ncbi:hypothetical protein NA57DRAFT_59000 [Rhizodiscina lignyota]|uniref:BRCT domain-containing protein n=1 Tax=Rhizodiscina lignyota TaxID=1504668 RepID=A0A9P4M3P2_9PEZI|nr:hypothetical protein NA57DRAFT_59000 [Rhizodiscina lignyota]
MTSTMDESLGSEQLAEIRRQLIYAPVSDLSHNHNPSVAEQDPRSSHHQFEAPNAAMRTDTMRQQFQSQIEDETSPRSLRDNSTQAEEADHEQAVEDSFDSPPHVRDRNRSRHSAVRRDNVPRLIPTKSSPAAPITMEGTPARLRMAHSFAGFVDAGDTQPMDSQIYKKITSSTDRSRDAPGDNSRFSVRSEEESEAVQHGDNGQIDLLSEWDQQAGDDNISDIDDEHMSGLSPETQSRVKAATFIVPKTPAMAGRKRDNRGQILSSIAETSQTKTSATKTPGSELAAMFAQNAGKDLISLTQAFNQTQAPSSPLPEGVRSDPVFERPSPNFVHGEPSSPLPRTSSPVKEIRSDPLRSATEPLETYRTMKESQEARARRMREEEERMRAEEGFEDEFDREMRRQERREQRKRLHVKLSSDALNSLDVDIPLQEFRSSSRVKHSSSRPNSRPATAQGLQRSPEKQKPVIEIADDDSIDESEEEQSVDKAKSSRSLRNVNAIEIPMTSSKNGFERRPEMTTTSSPIKGSIQPVHGVPATASQPEQITQSAPKATQTIAIADSQKEKPESQKENDDPDIAEQPGSQQHQDLDEANTITQSQFSISSNTRDKFIARLRETETSSITDPPPHTSQVQEHIRPVQADVPSSPPMLTSDARDDYDEGHNQNDETPLAEAPKIVQNEKFFKDQQLNSGEPTNGQTTVPESGSSGEQKQSRPLRSRFKTNKETATTSTTGTTGTSASNDTTLFHTARSQRTPSPPRQAPSQVSPSKTQAPRSTRARKLTEIAADPTPNQSFDQIDIDIDLMTADDVEFTNMMSGSSPVLPSRKKRKVYTAKKTTAIKPAQLLKIPPSTPSSARRQNEEEEEEGPASSPKQKQEQEAALTTSPPARRREQIVPTVTQARLGATLQNPESTLRRPGKLTRPSRKTPARLQPLSSTDDMYDPRERQKPPSEVAETPQAKNPPSAGAVATVLDYVDTREPVEDNMDDIDIVGLDGSAEKLTPNRVFARFRGLNNYYPATCLGLAKSDSVRFKVRFDDGTVDFVESQYVRRLELRVGDVIKIDLPSMRKDHIVRGFKDRIDPVASAMEPTAFPITDEMGFTTLVLSAKQRDSLSASAAIAPAPTVEVPIFNIYLTATMWPHFDERIYTHPSTAIAPAATPTNHPLPLAPDTPPSRSRRPTISTFNNIRTRESSASSFRQESTLFANMAFAVSFKEETSSERRSTMRAIVENGATLLEYGFDSLFSLPSLDKSHHDTGELSEDPLKLKLSSTSLGFVALITEVHSRRSKYLQALALGLPCLHYRWIQDCVAAKKLLPWEKYLLPAGESAWLGGVVRSRVLTPYMPADAKLTDTVQTREKLFHTTLENGQTSGVLLLESSRVGGTKSSKKANSSTSKGNTFKALDERRKLFLFMTYAIGATRVRRVKDMDEARSVLEDDNNHQWSWLYVDGDVGTAEHALGGGRSLERAAGASATGRERKRKRGVETDGSLELEMANANKKVKVVSDEGVIQSLILGALVV